MVIYMTHPVHGSKVACSEQEARYDEEKGWERFDPSTKDDEDEPVNELAQVKRKYTRRVPS